MLAPTGNFRVTENLAVMGAGAVPGTFVVLEEWVGRGQLVGLGAWTGPAGPDSSGARAAREDGQ
jgi:hypothetical protein